MEIRIFGLADDSIVDGPGVRYTVFVQGCPHHCPGCHNPASHDFAGGTLMDTDGIIRKIGENPLLDGVTLSGGEPMCQPEACARKAPQRLVLHGLHARCAAEGERPGAHGAAARHRRAGGWTLRAGAEVAVAALPRQQQSAADRRAENACDGRNHPLDTACVVIALRILQTIHRITSENWEIIVEFPAQVCYTDSREANTGENPICVSRQYLPQPYGSNGVPVLGTAAACVW